MWSLVDETKNQQPTKIFKIGTSTLSGQIQINARSFLIQFIESTCLSVTNVNHQWTITFWTWFHATYWFSLLYYFAAIRAKYVKKKVQFISTKGSKQPAFFFFGYEWSQHRWLLPVNKLLPERHKIATLPVSCMVKLVWPAVKTCALCNLMVRMGPTYWRSFSSYDTSRKWKSMVVHCGAFGIHIEKQNPAGGAAVLLGYI